MRNILLGIFLYFLKFSLAYCLLERGLGWEYFTTHLHGDSNSYLNPIIDLIEKGTYSSETRLPGYGLVFGLFYSLGLPLIPAYRGVVIIQILLSGLSFGLILTCLKELRIGQIPVFFLACTLMMHPYILYDFYISTESIATSLITILAYLTYKERHPLLAGTLGIWLIFLKPTLILLPVLVLGYWCFKKKSLGFLLTFLLPILVIEGAWIYRNYKQYQTFIPLTKRWFYREGEMGTLYGSKILTDFVRAYGGSHEFWEINSDIAWYYHGGIAAPVMRGIYPYPNFNESLQKAPPQNIMTNDFNLDSLMKIRSVATKIYLTSLNPASANITIECERELNYLNQRLTLYRKSIQSEKPFLFYVKSHLIRLQHAFFQFKFYDEHPFIKSANAWIKYAYQGVKIVLFFPFLALSILGAIAAMLALTKWAQAPFEATIALFTFSQLFVYIVVFKQSEFRYFMVIFPANVWLSCWLIKTWFGKRLKSNH